MPSAEKGAPYEPADYYKVEDLADWLHPWLEGRPFCAFSPKSSLCIHTSRARQMAEALLCEDGWLEGFMYHRLNRVIPPEASDR